MAMMQHIPHTPHIVTTDGDGDVVMAADDGSDSPVMPAIDLGNHAVPCRFRGFRPDRRSYRIYVMKLLYSGTWRYAFAFSNALPWFVKHIMDMILTAYQLRAAFKGMWKVLCMLLPV